MSEQNKDGGLIIGFLLSVTAASMTPRTRKSLPQPSSLRQTKNWEKGLGRVRQTKMATVERGEDKAPGRQK